jgi:hypothetical protein
MSPEVEVQIVVHLELGEHQHDTGGKAAPQTGLVADGQFALEVDAGHGLTDLLRTQIGQLDGQQVFQPLGAGCKKFFHHAHGDAIKIVPHYTLSARARHSNLGQRRHINGKRRGRLSPPPLRATGSRSWLAAVYHHIRKEFENLARTRQKMVVTTRRRKKTNNGTRERLSA